MKKLFCCLIAALCAASLTLPAMADVLPHGGGALALGGLLILLGVAAIAAAIIIVILNKRNK